MRFDLIEMVAKRWLWAVAVRNASPGPSAGGRRQSGARAGAGASSLALICVERRSKSVRIVSSCEKRARESLDTRECRRDGKTIGCG